MGTYINRIICLAQTQSYFVDNPRDLQLLRHDKALHTVKIQPHLADVPEYIVPSALKSLAGVSRPRKRCFDKVSGSAITSKVKAHYELSMKHLRSVM
jgi:ATP-dependent RNA helicase DDX56/DBP9